MPFRYIHLLLFALLIIFPSISASACNRSCGHTRNPVPYPFGFSAGCKIPLHCNGTDIGIGSFLVRNITADNLVVHLPVKCNRSINDIKTLWGRNYALTWKNGLLLRGCKPSVPGCVIPTAMVEKKLGLEGCSHKEENISCVSKGGEGLMSFDNVTGIGCGFLFSSFAFQSTENPVVSIDFQTVELEWWLEGKCGQGSCSAYANCTDASRSVDGTPGFRCRCPEGFEGDGFPAPGRGCRKVSRNCDASGYMTGHCGRGNRFGFLFGGIIAGASLMAVIAILCYLIRHRSTSLRTQKSARRLLSEAAGPCTVPFFTFREIEKATNGFSEKNMLGTGAYGTVYEGKFHDDEQVAVKKIRNRDYEGIEQVLNEIKLISSVSHSNLVRLLGCCIERGEQILVYEFMPNGTLSQHLQRERGAGLPWIIRLTIAADTAKAIAHLHSANPPIYHRDIKSSNILLDYRFKSKVADFGLSRMGMTESSHISTAPQGTPGYLDPQYHQNFHLSDKSDVYSFGVVLVEIITALKVVDFSRQQTEVNLAALAMDKIGKGCVDEIIDQFLEPHQDAWTLSSIHKVAEVAFRCLAFHQDMRPSMVEVAAELEQIMLNGCSPMEDTFFVQSAASSCSSPSNVSENSQATTKKASVGSRRLLVPQRSECAILMEEVNGCSPVSVQDPWFSEQSSPSSNSLLGNVVQ